MATSSTRRIRDLRRAVHGLYTTAGGTDPRGDDIADYLDPATPASVVREARFAVRLVSEGRVNGDDE